VISEILSVPRTIGRIHEASQRTQNGRQAAPKQEAAEELTPLPPGITGAMVLDDARAFAASILHATDEQLDALTLACAVSHTLGSFSTVCELLFTSDEKESGKTTGEDIVMMLANNGWTADPTSYALRAKFNEAEKPTLIIDEISDIFGRSGLRGSSNQLGKILRICYRRTATLSMAVDRVAEEVSCYTMAVMAGLKTAVPDDIRSRCVIFQVKPVPSSVRGLRDSQDDDTMALGKIHNQRLHQWARGSEDEIRKAFRDIRRPHPKFRARRAQIWGPLYAVALEAGDDWPDRCLAAFKAMALDASDVPVLSPSQMVLRDTAGLFAKDGGDRLFAAEIASHLRALPDVALYEDLTDRGLAQLMTEALGPSQAMTIGNARARGFHAAPVLAAWKRLEAQLEPPEDDEPEEDEYDSMFEVTEVTDDGLDVSASPQAGSVTDVTDNAGFGVDTI
jgi:hypothetical protein